jgi:hypothetical protein
VTEPVQKTGILAKPVFVRGGLPQAHQQKRSLPKPSRWAAHIDLGRQYPAWPNGQKPPPGYQVNPDLGWMLVSRVTRGGKRTTTLAITRDEWEIRRDTERLNPLERWQFARRTVKDTWCERELYMRFLGTLTLEQDVVDRAERKARYERRLEISKEKKAQAALDARNRARAEEEANRAKGRARG